MKILTALALAQQLLAAHATPVVHLDGYGSFTGVRLNESLASYPLAVPVDAWLGIDYAVQERFRPVEKTPSPFNGTRAAAKYGKVCIQDPTAIAYEQSEDCLNFNVYRPAGLTLNHTLPTLVWIYGGGFVQGSARSFDGAAFVAASKYPLQVVTFNYRVNSLGFLPSTLFKQEGLLNLGLRDQRFFLEFLQKHLSSFGGDPEQITLGGRSAGAHSTGIHYFHNYNDTEPLFARAICQSGSVTARAFPPYNYPQFKRDFEKFASYLNCSLNRSNAGQLSCLRSAPIESIQYISSKLFNESEASITWPFQPTQGGPLLERPGSESEPFDLPILTTSTTDEGKYYVPGNITNNKQFLDFFHTISPDLDDTDLALLDKLYPDPLTKPTSPYSYSTNSTQYARVAAAWSDYAYICPSRRTARVAASKGSHVHKMRFNAPDSPLEYVRWRGVPHTSDTRYTWADARTPDQETGKVLNGFLSEFVAKGQVDMLWPEYYEGRQSGAREQIVINPGGKVMVEKDDLREEQCEFWNDDDRAHRLWK